MLRTAMTLAMVALPSAAAAQAAPAAAVAAAARKAMADTGAKGLAIAVVA